LAAVCERAQERHAQRERDELAARHTVNA
jgi:hypothetical protein